MQQSEHCTLRTADELEYTVDDLQELLSSYKSLADIAEATLNETAGQVASGRAPSEEQMIKIDSHLTALRKAYAAIADRAAQVCSCDLDDATVFDCAEAIKTAEKANELKRQAEEARLRLERFISVRSKFDSFSEAIAPNQEKARRHLTLLRDADGAIPEEVREAEEEQSIFLEALDHADLSDESGFKLLDKVNKLFGFNVQYGLMTGKYYIPEGEEPSCDPHPEPAAAAAEEGQAIAPVEPETPSEPEKPEQRPAPTTQEKPLTKPSSGSRKVPATVQASVRIKKQQGNTSEFISTINRLPKATRLIAEHALSLLCLFGAVVPSQLQRFTEITGGASDKDAIVESLRTLTEKKLVVPYTEIRDEPVYCLSPYSFNCFKKDDVRKSHRWPIASLQKPLFAAEQEMSSAMLVERLELNEALFTYKKWADKQYRGFYPQEVLFGSSEGRSHVQVIWTDKTVYDCSVNKPPLEGSDDGVLFVLNSGDALPCIDMEEAWEHFCFEDGSLYRAINGTWVEGSFEKPGIGPADEASGEPFETKQEQSGDSACTGKDCPDKDSTTICASNKEIVHSTQYSVPSARKTLNGAPCCVRAAVPLLALFGVMSAEDMVSLVAAIGGFDYDVRRLEREMRKAFGFLSSKGFVSEYIVDDASPSLFSLTSNTVKLIKDRSFKRIKKGNRPFWELPFPETCTVSVDDVAQKDSLIEMEHAAALAISVLTSMKNAAYDLSTLQYVMESYRWNDGFGSLLMPINETDALRHLLSDGTKPIPAHAEGVLYVPTNGTCPGCAGIKHEKVLIAYEGRLFNWNGKCDDSEHPDGDELQNEAKPRSNDESLPHGETDSGATDDNSSDLPSPKPKEKADDANQQPLTSIEAASDTVCSPRELACALLAENDPLSQTESFSQLITGLVTQGQRYRGERLVFDGLATSLALAKALSMQSSAYTTAYMQLVLASDSAIEPHRYDSDELIAVFTSESHLFPFEKTLNLLALLRALFAPSTEYDYSLWSYAQQQFSAFDEEYPGLEALKPLFNSLLKLGDTSKFPACSGFTPKILRSFASKASLQEQASACSDRAKALLQTRNIIAAPMHAMKPMVASCFESGSDLGDCMSAIAENKHDDYDFVEMVFSQFCDGGQPDNGISDELVDEYLDEKWRAAVEETKKSGHRGGPSTLKHGQRTKVRLSIIERLNLIEDWLQITETTGKEAHNPAYADIRTELSQELEKVLLAADSSFREADAVIVKASLSKVASKLNQGSVSERFEFAGLLNSRHIPFDQDTELPAFPKFFTSQPGFEPWRWVVEHISEEPMSLEDALSSITNDSDGPIFDNISQAVCICGYINCSGGEADETAFLEEREQAAASAQMQVEEFKGHLELAFAYGQILEPDKELVSANVDEAFSLFDALGSYGCLRAYLNTLDAVLEGAADERLEALETELEARREAGVRSAEADKLLDLAEQELHGPKRNYALAEEYINRHVSGVYRPMDVTDDPADNTFLSFLDGPYNEIYELCANNCKRAKLSDFGMSYVNKVLAEKEFSNQYRQDSQNLVSNMPYSPQSIRPETIVHLLEALGFEHVDGARQAKADKRGSSIASRFVVDVRPSDKSKTEFSHPISIMGTKLASPLNVICLYGRKEASDIVDTVCKMELGGTAVVFLNGPLSIQSRRKIAEIFHKDKQGRNSFLIIDWVLMLHLACFPAAERMAIMLSCTLPYASSFQPFVKASSVPDEMFIGRKKELSQILDPAGPSVVYGGRQLGKTALLERACSQAQRPEQGEYGVLVRATSFQTEEELAHAIAEELQFANCPVEKADTIRELSLALREGHGTQWRKVRVFIDEADKMLEQFRKLEPAFGPITALTDLRRYTNNDFKFVLAGLHNVCRSAKESNSVFGQLGEPLCIAPLSPSDAFELLAKPLRYMGFTFSKDDLMHILVNTSFYPGIVHSVGYALVENLSTRYQAFYSPTKGNPPYELNDRQLSGVMSDEDLNKTIDERIRLTLRVDKRYFMFARCIAYLYYDNPEEARDGYPVSAILEYADLLGIDILVELTPHEALLLLREMVEMGILVEPSDNAFRLRQRRFLEAIGASPEAIEADIAQGDEED